MGVETISARPFEFRKRRQFIWKTALLAVATVTAIPILLWRHEVAAAVWVAFLVVVHVAGAIIFAIGVKRHDIAPTRHGRWMRILGIAVAIGLLYLVAKGLRGDVGPIFWGSLFGIWAIHTAALALMHIRGREEAKVCPFA